MFRSALLLIAISIFHVFAEYDLYFTPRSNAMGGAGVALADDESALFLNPAGIAIPSEKLENGRVCIGLNPMLNGNYYRSNVPSIIYQNSNRHFGSFALHRWTLRSKDKIPFTSYDAGADTISVDPSRAFQDHRSNLSITYANTFFLHRPISIALGITGTLHSFDEEIDSTIRWYTTDCGLLTTFPLGFRAGIFLGQIHTQNKIFTKSDISSILKIGPGWKHSFQSDSLKIADIAITGDFSRTRIIANSSDFIITNALGNALSGGRKTYQDVWAAGSELRIFNTLSLQFGGANYAYADYIKLTKGIGLQLFNHFDMNFATQSYLQNGVQSRARSFSLSIHNLTQWKHSDLRWWKHETSPPPPAKLPPPKTESDQILVE